MSNEITHREPQRVCVAIYEHRFGADVRAFAHRDQALVWRTALAKEWWSDAFKGDPPADDVIGEEYFERMLERDEFFSTHECELEISAVPSADPTRPGRP